MRPPPGAFSSLTICRTPQQLAAALSDLFVAQAHEAIAARGTFFTALSGGSTPKAAYSLLAAEPRRSSVQWAAVQIFFGDERCVGPDDAESNYKMARDAFLNAVAIPGGNVHRIRGEAPPQQAAGEYAQLLIASLGQDPIFDLILLGMGADGHTASLFPGEDPATDSDALVRAVYPPDRKLARVTITPKIINAARHVAIAVEGLPKAPALYAALRGPREPHLHPIQIVAPRNGELTWLVDESAAAELG